MSDDAALLAIARRLAHEAAVARPLTLSLMAGGKNNRVFQVALADGSAAVLKSYHVDARDTRDRLGAEWAFIQYAWARGVRCVPQPLAADLTSHTALYRFVPGRKLMAAEITRQPVQAAIDFVIAVNEAPREVMRLAPASEACFSLDDHLATVDRRVGRLDALDPTAPLIADVARFVSEQLQPTWCAVRERIVAGAARVGIDPHAAIAATDHCISPSDFGFHNALADDAGRMSFIDFEYAGRDDPAKLICDFFCQPELPVPAGLHDLFRRGVLSGLAPSELTRVRCGLLLDAYRVKWTCIMLNEFLPVGAARRTFANPDAYAERCAQQLQKVRRAAAEIIT